MASVAEICILAGGLSQRMGRDKARLRLRGKTLLTIIRGMARATKLPVRVIRRDAIPRCGPLGGVYTALRATRNDLVLFLACDMPFVTTKIIFSVLKAASNRSVFVRTNEGVGMPFVLPRTALPIVRQQLEHRKLSLSGLARALGGRQLRAPISWLAALRNINTPAEWAEAKALATKSQNLPA